MKIDELITAAQAALTQVEALPPTDTEKTSKVEAAKSQLQTLQNAKQAAQQDINAAVTGRLPGAEESAKKAEREAQAKKLGVTEDKLDEELDRIAQERSSQQTEAQRLQGTLSTREAELQNAQAERDKNKRVAETARANLEETLKKNAVERQLLSQGVTNTEEQSYLSGAVQLTDFSKVEVEVEVDDEGNLKVKGEVKGAKEAAEATKKAYPAMFGEGGFRVPKETPIGSRDQDTSKGLGGYKPRYVRPRAS